MTTAIVLAGIILLLLVISLALQKRTRKPNSIPRKVLHIGAISVCAAAVYLVDDADHILIAAFAALPLVIVAVAAGLLKDDASGRRSWGMVYFVIAYIVLLWFFRHSRPDLVFYPMAVLAWADGLATVVGERFGKRRFRAAGDMRTIEGSVAFFLASFSVLGFSGALISEPVLFEAWGLPLTVAVSAFLTLVEAASASGRDNLWVPLGVVYWIGISPDIDTGGFFVSAAFFLTMAAAVVAFRRAWLNAGGAVVACLLGWVLLISPMPVSIVPALIFFLLGTAFSLLPRKMSSKVHPERPSRSAVQVMANGGAPVASLLLFFAADHSAFLVGFIAGFAAALSDTSSSEIGTRVAAKSYAIIGLRQLRAGVSGGISLPGTLAGIVFAGVIPAVAVPLGFLDVRTAVVVAGLAFSANLADSLLGQFTQRKRTAADGSWEDVADPFEGNKIRGFRWMSNDAVNAIAVTLSTIAAVAYCYF